MSERGVLGRWARRLLLGAGPGMVLAAVVTGVAAADVDEFTTTWDTTKPGVSDSASIQLPLVRTGDYQFSVDWGDGKISAVDAWDDPDARHTYDSAGTYTVKISGTLKGWAFYNAGDRLKIVGLSRWGGVNLGNQGGAFLGAENMQCTATAADVPDMTGVTILDSTFEHAGAFNCPLGNWDVSQVISMRAMFAYATTFNQDLDTWDTSAVKGMTGLFFFAEAFNGDVTTWDTSSVQGMMDAFGLAKSFDQSLAGWDLSGLQGDGSRDILWNTAWSMANYSRTLVGWAAQSLPVRTSSFAVAGVDAGYWCAAGAARDALAAKGWTFVDKGQDTDDCFTSTWDTSIVEPGSSGATEIRLPLYDGGTYDFLVDWGDGDSSAVTSWDDATHAYAAASTPTIKISGPLNGWSFNNSGDSAKITGISKWGTLNFGNHGSAFAGAENLVCTASDAPDLSGVTTLAFTFAGASKFNCGVAGWDVRDVESLEGMFSDALAFNQPLNGWNTAKVTTTEAMFADAKVFNQPLDLWDVSGVEQMTDMFNGASDFNGNITGWQTTSVSSMEGMFREATSFNQNIGGWNPDSLGAMESMFYGATAFNQDLSGWNTGSVASLQGVFGEATSFDQDLSAWDIADVTTMSGMLDESGLSTLNYARTLIGWSATTTSSNVALGAKDLTYLCIASGAHAALVAKGWTITDAGPAPAECFDSRWKTDNPGTSTDTQIALPLVVGGTYNFLISWGDGTVQRVTSTAARHTYPAKGTYYVSISGTLKGWRFNNDGDRLKILSISTWGDLNFGNRGGAFSGAANLTVTATDAPDLTGVTTLQETFFGAEAFNGAIGNWDVSAVTDMSLMFDGALAFDQDLSAWDTSSVKDMGAMFMGADAFNHDIGSWQTGAVNDMSYMFSGTNAFNQDIGGWDTSNVTSMEVMFRYTARFDQDLSRWDTSAVKDLGYMFLGAQVFNHDISAWNTASVTSMAGMFRYSRAFDHSLGAWNVTSLTDANYMFDQAHLSALNYSKTLVGWSKQAVLRSVPLVVSQRYNCAAAAARQVLVTANWQISDDGRAPGDCFVSAWDPWGSGASPAATVTLPLVDHPDSAYDFVVAWGDGSSDVITSATDPAVTHVYGGSPQRFEVHISGTLRGWSFHGAGDAEKFTYLGDWGSFNPGNAGGAFQGAKNLFCATTGGPDLTGVTNLRDMFAGASLFDCPVADWDLSKVTNMAGMFYGASHFDRDLGGWNVGSATTMADMLTGSGLSTTSYSATLKGWAAQIPQTGVTLTAGPGLHYTCDARAAHDRLTSTFGWAISDGGSLPCVSLTPSSVSFGDEQTGVTSDPRTVTVRNTGGMPLAVFGLAVDAPFSSESQCAVVPAGGTCTVALRFRPVGTGDSSAVLKVFSNAVSSPDTVAVSGTGVPPAFSASPDALRFGKVRVGRSSTAVATVTNPGTGTLAVSTPVVTEPQYRVAESTCGRVAAGASCTVTVLFSPTATGVATGSLWLPSNRGDYAMPVTGTGVARAQTFGIGLPKRIKLTGLTLLTPAGARTNAGQLVQTLVQGGPTAAGETRYFTVVRGRKGKVSVRTFGHHDLKLVVIQRAPATGGYGPWRRAAVYVGGRRT